MTPAEVAAYHAGIAHAANFPLMQRVEHEIAHAVCACVAVRVTRDEAIFGQADPDLIPHLEA